MRSAGNRHTLRIGHGTFQSIQNAPELRLGLITTHQQRARLDPRCLRPRIGVALFLDLPKQGCRIVAIDFLARF